jgi:RNA polymerase sigma-70 factor (ECF subfamily)
MQECFAYLISKFPGFALTSSMTTFLFPVVRNLSLARRRGRGNFESSEVLEGMVGLAHVDLEQSRAELASAMANLPANQRETLLLRFVDDLSIEEIAAAMDVPQGTVKSRIHHAIATLREDPRARRYFL